MIYQINVEDSHPTVESRTLCLGNLASMLGQQSYNCKAEKKLF